MGEEEGEKESRKEGKSKKKIYIYINEKMHPPAVERVSKEVAQDGELEGLGAAK